MPRTSYKVFNSEYPYFVTCNFVDWIPLFSIPEVADIVLESLIFHQVERNLTIFAYVLMENHLHMVVQSDRLQKRMRTFKSFTAREIVNHLKDNGHKLYLRKLKSFKLTHHKNSDFQVWQEGYHPKQIAGDKMMIQKIDYIHQNPVKRGYIAKAEHWRYSSAKNYLGKEGLVPVTLNWS